MARSKRIGLLVLSLVLVSGLGFVQVARAAAPLAGRIVFIQGEVSVRAKGVKEWTPAPLNKELHVGDAVKTGPLSRAAILCTDESQVKVNENSILILKHVLPSPRLRMGEAAPAAEKGASSIYQVPQGEIWLRNKNDKFRFEMETPAATATIRGTEFNLLVKPDGATSVTLLEGNLCLINPQGEVCLVPGEEGSARPGEVPAKRLLVQPADAVQWVLYYPGIFSYRDLPLAGPEEVGRLQGPPALASLVRQGETSYDQGKLTEAQGAAEAVLAQDPENSRALTLLGWVSLQHRAPAEARGYFRRVRQPLESAIIGEALARCQLGEVTGAYELVKTVRSRSRSLPLLTMEGYLAMLVGKAEAARTLLEAAVRQTEAPLPRSLLAQLYLVQNRKDAALKEAAAALSLTPNSPLALFSLALVKLAYFDLPAATGYLQKAVAADPRFVEAYIYLAKVWLGSDYLARAQKTIEPALQLAPRDAVVLSLAGFIRLAYRDYDGAKGYWRRALDADPSLGEPHLGLAIYNFRHRDFSQGLSAMLTATLLEPRVSLYQSELGKALYQTRAFDKALEVYDYAATLDSKDPTPHYYKGIALSDLNRPGDAIQEINRSIALNDNVASFRSRSLLDRDLAVRNFSLARAYQQLGLTDWGFSKAVTAVKYQPFNSAAHLFLFDILTGARAGSEAPFLTGGLLFSTAAIEGALYRVLSPANQATFGNLQLEGLEYLGFTNDYAPMFEMPYARLGVMGGIGASEGSKSIQDHQYFAYGGVPGAAFETFGHFADDRGTPRPSDATLQSFSGTSNILSAEAAVKWEPTVQGVLTGFYRYDALKQTDTQGQIPPALQSDVTNFRQRLYELAYYYRFNPESAFLAYAAHKDLPYHLVSRFFDLPTSSQFLGQQTFDQEFTSVQLQKHQAFSLAGQHYVVAGFDYFSSNVSQRLMVDLLGVGTLFQADYRPPFWSYSFYLQDYWRPTPNLVLELALWKDFQKDPSVGFAGNTYTSMWSPRFGANYQFGAGGTQHVLRAMVERHLTTHLVSQPVLVPSEIGGFPWVIDASSGSEVRQAGAAWEAQWNSRTFTALRLNALRVATPAFATDGEGFDHRIFQDYTRYQASLVLNRILAGSLGLSLGVMGKRVIPDYIFTPSLESYSELNAYVGLAYLHPQGWLARIRPLLMQQFGKIPGHQADNPFVIMNFTLGREFPNKRGFALFELQNLFNRQPFYSLEPRRDLDFPMKRRYLFRLGLFF
jgi:tetratricopeptide (TPR) repeat protein